MSENGWEVYLVGVNYKKTPERIFIQPAVKMIYCTTESTGIKNIFNYFKLIFFLTGLSVRKGVKIFIGYDSFAVLPVFLASTLTFKKWVYHQHDYFENPKTFFQKMILLSENKLSKFAAFTVFPQQQRAEIFFEKNKLKAKPLIVYNGPRKEWAFNKPGINSGITDIRSRFRRLLIYQGSLAKWFSIENLIYAVKKCRSDIGVIILGKEIDAGIKENYLALINELGMGPRFQFVDFVPYEEIPSITSFCDLGIAKLTNDDDQNAPLNDRFLIGASNKITEYIACGLPVMTSLSAANKIFLEHHPVGFMCNVQDPGDFAASIDGALLNETAFDEMKKNNVQLFLDVLNYDTQFEKCKNALEALIN